MGPRRWAAGGSAARVRRWSSLSASELLFEKEGQLAWITFNRPEARNAMTWAMYARLEELCDLVETDSDVRVVVLRGAGGKAFVAGTDIGQFAAFREPRDALEYEERIDRVISRLERIAKPTVAMIEGFCIGGGAGIALTCDLRYCTPDMKFGFPIARTLGNCLSMANYARLLDAVGPARAKEMIMLARLVEAGEALALGLVNEVVPAEGLEARVREVAATLAEHAPLTLRATKEAIRRIQAGRRIPPAEGEDLILSCYMSDDFRAAVRAFLEKRRYTWTGR